MTDDDERMINALENALSKKIDDCRRAQAALSAARRRLGLFDPQQFYTAAQMDDARAESRAEMREITKATIADCRLRWLRGYVPTPLEKAMAQWPAAFAALEAGKQAQAAAPKARSDNVVSFAEQIAAAGRRRRGESS
jgi:hypothetical protein